MTEVNSGVDSAILKLGELHDRTAVPFLRKLYSQPNKAYGGAASFAQMALAKLGEEGLFEEIAHELDSSDPDTRENATKKLAYVGGKESIRVLIGQLDKSTWQQVHSQADDRLPPNSHPLDKVFFEPANIAAMRALSKIAPNPPVHPDVEPKQEHVAVWRRWWTEVGNKLPDERQRGGK